VAFIVDAVEPRLRTCGYWNVRQPDVVPNNPANITFGGSGNNRTGHITPARAAGLATFHPGNRRQQ
jgi:hypothetical protein